MVSLGIFHVIFGMINVADETTVFLALCLLDMLTDDQTPIHRTKCGTKRYIDINYRLYMLELVKTKCI